MRYVIVDLEMCRVPKNVKREVYGGSCEIIEIGAVLLDDAYEIADRFKTYVCPQYGRIDGFIRKLTGISQADTDGAPSIKEALELFVNWLPDDAIPVSWSESDEKQIRKELTLKGIEIAGLDKYLDVWEDCQKTFGEKMNSERAYRLSDALNITGIDYDENIHDGLVDAENTALLFAKMQREPDLKLIACYMTEDDDTTMYTPIAGLLKNFSFAV